jgi:hypothetical protein
MSLTSNILAEPKSAPAAAPSQVVYVCKDRVANRSASVSSRRTGKCKSPCKAAIQLPQTCSGRICPRSPPIWIALAGNPKSSPLPQPYLLGPKPPLDRLKIARILKVRGKAKEQSTGISRIAPTEKTRLQIFGTRF